MNKQLMRLSIAIFIIGISFSACSGCVKEISKKATELSMDALEGVVEAVDERGEKLAEKTTDAAGTIVGGIGKSAAKQLEENAEAIAKSTGIILVNTLDGFVGSIEEMETSYQILEYSTISSVNDIEVYFVGKQKLNDIVDSYIVIPQAGQYKYKFTGYDALDKVLIAKETTMIKTEDDERHYTLISFGLDKQERRDFSKIKKIELHINKVQ